MALTMPQGTPPEQKLALGVCIYTTATEGWRVGLLWALVSYIWILDYGDGNRVLNEISWSPDLVRRCSVPLRGGAGVRKAGRRGCC